eukprot:4436839-Amphidinium_carterae.1
MGGMVVDESHLRSPVPIAGELCDMARAVVVKLHYCVCSWLAIAIAVIVIARRVRIVWRHAAAISISGTLPNAGTRNETVTIHRGVPPGK